MPRRVAELVRTFRQPESATVVGPASAADAPSTLV